MSEKQIILSGMRPTGRLHLGNYLGALKNWVKLQDEYKCYFEIADWHALMSDYETPVRIKELSHDMICVWLASGIDPEKSVIFKQSEVSQHLELFFILSVITPLGWLERCPTYKEALESASNVSSNEKRNYAFLGYPVLQAADIVLYGAEKVPVGVDQLPHLELTREIVRRFNYLYSTNVEGARVKKNGLNDRFLASKSPPAESPLPMVEPEEILTKVPKLKGTDLRKMSKSFNNTIYLTEEKKDIEKKVKSMITDPARIHPLDIGHPDVCTVFEYHRIFSISVECPLPDVSQIEKQCSAGKIGCVECKQILSENLEKLISPIREKYKFYRDNDEKVNNILEEGNAAAREVAAMNLKKFKKAIGI